MRTSTAKMVFIILKTWSICGVQQNDFLPCSCCCCNFLLLLVSLWFVVAVICISIVVSVVICSCCCQCCIPVDCCILLLSLLLSHCWLLLPLFSLLLSPQPFLLPWQRSLMPDTRMMMMMTMMTTNALTSQWWPSNSLFGEEALPLAGCPQQWGVWHTSNSHSLMEVATSSEAQQPLLQGGVPPLWTRTLAAVPITTAPPTKEAPTPLTGTAAASV